MFNAVEAAARWEGAAAKAQPQDTRKCTCHPDDNPPRPCPRKFALTECRKAAAQPRAPGEFDVLVKALTWFAEERHNGGRNSEAIPGYVIWDASTKEIYLGSILYRSAQAITTLTARLREAEAECSMLAADQCHAGYGDERGNHRCREVDESRAKALEEAAQWHEAQAQLDEDSHIATTPFLHRSYATALRVLMLSRREESPIRYILEEDANL
jgi:hypothetical protein